MELTETYLKGFNQAYLLAKHTPKLLEKILDSSTENEYLQGMSDGKKAFEQEKEQSRSHDRLNELNQLRSRGDREQDREL